MHLQREQIVYTRLFNKMTIALESYNKAIENERLYVASNRSLLPYLLYAVFVSESKKRIYPVSDFSMIISLLSQKESTVIDMDSLHSLSCMLFDEGVNGIDANGSDLRSKAFESPYFEFTQLAYNARKQIHNAEGEENLQTTASLLELLKKKCEILGKHEGLIMLINEEIQVVLDRISSLR